MALLVPLRSKFGGGESVEKSLTAIFAERKMRMTSRELGEQQLGVLAPQSPQCSVLLEEQWGR